jgi:hypothetical protein
MYINGYEVTAVGDSTKRCTASGALPDDTQPLRCEISGLTNGVSYSFIARASAVTTTSPGVSVTGLFSAATSSVRPSGLPSAPTPVTAYSLPGGAVVAWSTPATTGGTSITGYNVTVRPNGLVPGVVVGDPIVTAFDATARLARISSLVNSISYSIEVAAVNDAGSGPAGTTSSFWAPVTTKPLDVVAVPGDSSATVTWTEPAIVPVPIQTYTVTATNYYDDSDVVEQTADSSPFIFTGLRNGLTYSFTVSANNDAGASPVSDASSSIIPAALPSVPTETSLDVAPGTVSVFWQRPISDGGRPIESYIVELATNQPGRTPATKVVTESSAWVYSGQGSYLATQWSGLTNGYDYTVRIAATTAAGNSEFVTIGTVTPRGRTTAPSLISLTPSNGTLTANFSAPSTDGGSPVTEYVVTDGVGHSCTIDAIAHPGVTECTIAGLVNGQTYSFKVTATNSFGSTDSASRMSGAPTALVPGTPTNVVGVGVDRLPGSDVIYPGIIQVSWATPSTDGGAPIIKYVVTDRWNSANTCSAWVTPLDPTPTSCAMTGFVAGYGYTFRVVAWNEVGASVASSVSAPAFAGGTPNAPEITGITGGSRSVDVGGGFMNYATATATVSPGATNGRPITGYRLKAVDQSNQYTQYFTSATATIVADQLTAGRSYRLSVQAQNDFGYGDWSPQSSTIYASYPPLAATGVTAVPTEGGATISYSPPSWNGSTATYAVTVNDLTLSTSWTEPAESYSTSVSGLTNGHSYSFAITATNFAGAGPMSGASAPVTPNLMPNAPRNIAPTIGDRSISVAFDAPTSRDGATVTAYKVAVTNISSRAVVFATGAASPIQVSGLTNGAGYQVSVVAVNGAVDGQAATFGSTVTPAGTPVMLQPSPTYYEDGATTVTLTTINLAGGSFIKYTVYVSEATTPLKLVKTVETTTSPVVITGLTNGTRYAIQAKVTTTGGSSSLMTQGGASILPVGRPSAPSILNVVASGTSAAVSIADPASTGGSAITGYTVTATSSTDASRTRTSSGSGSPVTVTGLIPGDTYLFSAVASNAVGSGGNARGGSGPSSSSVPAAPSFPTSVTASEGDGSTQIAWTAPVSAFGESVVSYRATASPGGAFCESTVLHNCLITGLTNYTPYQVTVSARNAGGSTSASSVEVTPKPVTSASSAPSAPRSVTVDPRSSSLVVTWAMPSDDGGGAIRSFTATASPGGGSCTSQALTTCAISGVDPYALYTVSVTATNSFGTSSAGVSTEVSACGLPASLSVAANGCDPIQAAATSVRAEFVDGGVKVSWNPQYRLTSIATAAPSGGSCSADYWTAPRNADNTVYCVILGSFDPATSFRVSSGSWPPDTSGSVHAKRITLNVPSATRDLIPHATGTISGGSSVLVVAAPISCANVLSCAGAVVFPTSATGGAFDVALSGLSEGSYNVFAADSDTSATLPYTAPQVMTVDRTQPRLDVNGSSTGIQTVFGPTAKVFGTAECAVSTSFGIDWYAGPTASGSVIATTNPVRAISVGTATCSFESDLAGLADGTYTTVSSMTDAAGNSTTVEMVVVVDNMAPALSVATPIAGSTVPSGVFVVRGAAAIDATDRSVVSLSAINGADSIARDIAVNSDGSWSASLVLSPGEWSFTFTQSDLAGNSTVVTRTLTVGVVGESVRIELPASDAIVGQAATVAGWAIAGSTVSLVSGSTDLGSVVADELGAWSKAVVLPSDAEEIAATVFDETDVVALSIGSRPATVDIRFPAPSGQTNGRLLFGSGPASTSLTVQIDSTSTVVQTDSSGMWSIPLSSFSEGVYVVTASDGSTSDSGSLTIERAPPTVGFVQPQAEHTRDRTVTLRSSDLAGNSQSVLLRYYSGTITSGDPIFTDRVEFLNGVAAASMPSQLSDGQWTLVAQRQDASGNVGSASVTFDFDTTAPTVSSNLRPAMPGPLVISGAASANAGDRAPVITIDGQSWTAPTTGPFSYQPTPAIVSGTHTVTVSQSDTAGNVESVTLSVIVDGVPPELTLESFFRSGTSSVSFIGRARYNDGAVTAVATPDDASLATPAVANLVPDVNGYWVGSLQVAPGYWTIAFTRTDFAGNVSTITRRYLSVDNAPDLVIDSPMGPTRNGVVTVSGTTSTESWRASTVQIEIRRVSDGSVAYSADALVVNGQYSSTTPSLAEGSYEFTVTRNDSVFPISRSGTFSVDTIAPTPLFDSVTAEPIAQLCGTAGTASGDLQSIGLVWTAGGTGSTSTQTVTAQNGRFCAAPPWSGLWSVQATQFDGTGSSSISASATFDVVAPVVTVATTSATTDSASPAPWAGTISGTAGFAIGDEQSVTLSLTLDSSAGYGWSNMSYCHSSVYVAGSTLICARSFIVPVLADGTWSFDLSTLGEGFWHVVSVRQADASGNIGMFEAAASPSNINELTGSKTVVNRYRFRVDRVAPPTPVLAPASNGVTMSVCGADTPFAYSSRLLVFRGSTAGVPVAVVPMPSASQCSQTPTLLVKQNRPGTLPISLPNGVYQVVGESTDPLGRVVRSASLEYRSSWVVPAVSLAITGTVPRPQDSGGPVSAFGEAITLSGVAAYNDVDPSTVKVTVTQNSGDTSYRSSLSTASEILVSDVTVQADGTWSLRLPSTFPIGTFTANVTQGTGTTSAVKFAVTGGSPAIDAVTVRASQQSNGAIVKTLTIRGSAPTDRTLDSTTVSLCGIVTVTNGRWSCSVTGDYADGSTKFTVTSKTSVAYTKSTTTGVWTNGVFSYNVALAPATGLQTSTTTYTTVLSSVLPKPTITTPLPTGSVPITGSVTVSGAAATTTGALPAVTVNVYSGSTATGVASQTATVTAAGSPLVYSKAFTLGDGVWTVQAVQSDGAGNTGVSDPVTIGVDATAPELTISAPLAGARSKSAFITGSLTGSTSRVGPVDYSRFPIDYRPAVYEGTISYYSGLTATGTPALVRPIATEPVTTAWGGGNFSYNYDNKWSDVPALTSGTWTAKVEAADPAGNSTQRLVTFTIDPTASASLLPVVSVRVGDDATLVEGHPTTPAVWSNAQIAVSTGFDAGRAPAISGGTVTLFDGDSVLGTASVVDGVATIRVLWSRTTSDYQLKAHYSGDSNYQAVTTPTVPVTAVAPAPTVVRLIPDFPNGAANPGRFTMTVARPVRQENGTTIESACVNGGTATITDGSGRVLSSQSLTDLRQPWSLRYSSVVAGQLDYTTTTLNSPWTTTVGGPQRVTLQTSGGPDCGPSTTTFDVNIPAVPAPSSTISVASPQGSAFIVGDDVAVTFTISGSAPVGLPVSIVDQAGTTVAGPVMFTNTSAWSSPIRYAAGCWRDNSCNPPSIYVHGATATLHFSAALTGNLSFRGVVGGGSSGYTSVAQSFSVPVEPDRIALSLSNTPTRAGENSTVTLGVGGPALQGQVGIYGRNTSTLTPTLACTSQSCGATSSLPSEMISSGGDAVLNASFQSSITQQTYTVSAPLQRALWQPALTVEAGPGVPVGVTAVASMSEAIRVSWTAPSANASTISGYTVLASPGGATCTTSGDTTCEISGLTNGTEYSFAVVANSNFGASSPAIAWATPTATVIASAPDPASALPAGTVVRDKLVPVRSVLTFPEAMATQFRSSGTVTLSSAPDPVLCAAGSRDETVLAYCANTRHLVTVDLAGLTSTESLMINGIARDLLPADSLKSLNASKSDFVPVTTASWAGNTLTVLTQMYVGGTGFSITGRFNPTPTTFVAPATTRGATTDTDAHIAGAGAPLTKISIASAKITGGWYGPVDSNPSSFYPTLTDFSGWDVRNPRVGETAFVKATLDPVFSVPSDNNVPANLAESVPGAAPLFVPADHGNRFADDRMATSATPARLGGRDSWNPYYGQSALSGLPSCSRCHIWTIRNLETTSPVESGGALPVGTWSLGLITYAPGTGTVSAGSLNERSARVGISTFDLSVDPWTTTLSAQASFSNGSINVVTAARWQGMPIEVQAPYENVMISVFLQRGGVDIPIAICFYNGICLDDDGNGTTFLPTSVTTVGARLAMVIPTATLGFTPTAADTVNVVTSAPWGVTADSGPLALNPPTVVSNSSGGASVLVSSKSMGVTLENQPSLSSPVPLFGSFGWQIADARAALAQFSFDLFKSMFRDATVARIFMSLTQVTLSFVPGYSWLNAVTCGSWICAAALVGSSVAGFALRGVSAGIGVLAKGWKAAKSALGIADTPSKIGMYVARAMAPIGRLQTRLAKAVPVRVKEAMSGEASAVSTIFKNYAKAYGKKGLNALYGDDVRSTLGINVVASVAPTPVQPRFWVSGPSDLSFSPSTRMINELSDMIIAQEANANQAVLQNWQAAIQRAYDKALAQPAPETNIGYGSGIGFRLNQFFATIATVSVPNLATLDMAASSIWIGVGENEFGHCDFNGNCAMKPGVSIIVLDGSILVSGLIPGWESGGTYNVEVRVQTVASNGGATNDYLGTSSFTAPGSLYACRAILREMDAIVAQQGGYNTERYFGEYSMRYTEDGRWYTFGDPNAGFGLGRIVTSNLRASQDRLCESIELMWEHLHGGIYPDLPAPQYVAPFDPAKQISPQTLSLVGGL